jgi:ADP-ribose pyrophosphatase YjhB (NUDIX family)
MKEKTYHLGVKALIRNEEGKILLLKVNQAAFKNPHTEDYWDIPGGRVIIGHTIEETLSREIEEETGITALANVVHLDTVISNMEIPLESGEKAGLILSIYDCRIEDPVSVHLSEEHTGSGWFDPQEAARLLSYKYPAAFTEKVRSIEKDQLKTDRAGL